MVMSHAASSGPARHGFPPYLEINVTSSARSKDSLSKLQQKRGAVLWRSGRGTLDIANYYSVEEHVVANGLPHWRGTAKKITGDQHKW